MSSIWIMANSDGKYHGSRIPPKTNISISNSTEMSRHAVIYKEMSVENREILWEVNITFISASFGNDRTIKQGHK